MESQAFKIATKRYSQRKLNASRRLHNLTQLENRLNGETNIGLIQVLEDQIRVCETAIINLKRSWASSLNVSTPLPQST